MRGRSPLLGVVLLGFLGLLGPSALRGQISPGPLAEAHRELEGSTRCGTCHDPKRGVDPRLCLDCHRLLGERIDAGLGLHADPSASRCETCHVDHHGRDFQLVWWGEGGTASFDHSATGYPLVDAHRKPRCRSCHREELIEDPVRLRSAGKSPNRSYLGLPTTCRGCHDDPHRQQFGKRLCSDCHDLIGWKPAPGFDHQRTLYPLTGRHTKTRCELCHRSEVATGGGTAVVRYIGAPSRCADCHRDPHEGRLVGDCARCHDTESFRLQQPSGFDHDLTRYPLRRAHRRVACERCHQGGRERTPPPFSRCADCHRDVHLGTFRTPPRGGDCDACHDLDAFRPARYSVDDHAVGRYPLAGAHLAIPCTACHTPAPTPRAQSSSALASHNGIAARRYRWPDLRCASCHEDPHRGELNRYSGNDGCASCHRVESWDNVTFDHDRSRWPLAGRHREKGCAECHTREDEEGVEGRLQLSGLPLSCEGCHADPHRGQLAKSDGKVDCLRCHDQDGWEARRFDHRRDSIFPLEGAHDRTPCGACHPLEGSGEEAFRRFRPLPQRCLDCHRPAKGTA